MSTRNQIADLLKGIAVVLMIQVHVIELFASNSVFQSDIGRVLLFLGGPPVAPIFTIILGYFIASSEKSSMQLIVRGFKTICLGMLLNIALNLNLILSVSKGLFQIDLLPYIFGVDILQFAGMSIIIIAVLKNRFKNNILLLISCILLFSFLSSFMLAYIPENASLKYISSWFYGSVSWSYFPLFPWLSYPLIGFAFYQLKQNYKMDFLVQAKIKVLLGILFLLFFAYTFKYAISTSSNLPLYYHHGFLFFIYVISFVGFYSFCINEFETLFGKTLLLKYIKWLGKNVTLIYVIQWVIIGNSATPIYKTIESLPLLFICYLSVLLVSSAVAYLSIEVKKAVTKKSED